MGIKIKIIGIGGAGQSAVDRMISSKLKGVDFVAINTDSQALSHSKAQTRIAIGQKITKGCGVGGDPIKGSQAAKESTEKFRQVLEGTDMLFITCGEGGGTGTGGAPVIASSAKQLNILTVGMVTKPFSFEGKKRKAVAQEGIKELKNHVDTLIVIPNDRLVEISDRKTPMLQAFEAADNILTQGVRAIVELIIHPGLINIDLADIRSIMSEGGLALLGVGQARGTEKTIKAAQKAISSPLFELPINGAKGILFNITSGKEITVDEIDEAAKLITKASDPEAKIIFGVITKPSMGDKVTVTVIATGIGD